MHTVFIPQWRILRGLKQPRRLQVQHASSWPITGARDCRRESAFLLFPGFRGSHVPRLVAPSTTFKASHDGLSLPYTASL